MKTEGKLPKMILWLTLQERDFLVTNIASCLDQVDHSIPNSQRDLLLLAQHELSVAEAREISGKIAFSQLRKVIGQESTSVPVHLSHDEREAIAKCLTLPIDLRRKLVI